MKTSSLALALLLTVASGAGAFAADTAKDSAKTNQPKPAATANPVSKQPTYVTGSYIKKDVRREKHVAEDPNLVVIDQAAIERSGASSVVGVLVRKGSLR